MYHIYNPMWRYTVDCTHTDSNFLGTNLHLSSWNSDSLTCTCNCRILCKSNVFTVNTFSILELGTFHGNQHFTSRFLAGLFTFLSSQLAQYSWKELVQNYHHDYKKEKNKSEVFALSFVTLCWAAKYRCSRLQMNGRKIVMLLETDTGSELPLTSSNVTHPVLAELCQLWNHTVPIK